MIHLSPHRRPVHLFKRPGSLPEPKVGARVSEHRLRNGMQVLLAERHGDPVVAAVLAYRVGSRNEPETLSGISHFLEHMMFKGTERLGKGEVDRVTTALGGQNNAFTGYDHTAYWFELASDRWEHALDIEADRMRNLLFDPDEFDAERTVVLDELAGGEDDPWRVLSRHVEAAVFPRHPYGRPIIGYPDTLAAMTPEDMRAFYGRYYHPGNATLVLAGDFSPRKALAAVRARFGGVPSAPPGTAELDGFRPVLEEPAGPMRITTRWDDEARRLVLAWRTTPVGTDADYALDLALLILAGGRTSRLQRRLVYDGDLAVSISASNDTRVESGAFWLFVECAQGADPEELEAVVDEELRCMATELVSAKELKRAKAMMKASEAFDAETASDLAEELGEWAVDADWRMAFDGGVRHDAITAKVLRATAARFLSPERRVTGWSLPRLESFARRGRATKRRSVKRRAAKSNGSGAGD